jgi:hypothetical protein
VIQGDYKKVTELGGRRESEQFGEEVRRLPAIPCGHDGVVERDCHVN